MKIKYTLWEGKKVKKGLVDMSNRAAVTKYFTELIDPKYDKIMIEKVADPPFRLKPFKHLHNPSSPGADVFRFRRGRGKHKITRF